MVVAGFPACPVAAGRQAGKSATTTIGHTGAPDGCAWIDASAAFGWRVVTKRKDITGDRLAKFAVPKINHPDPDILPTLPSGRPEPPKK